MSASVNRVAAEPIRRGPRGRYQNGIRQHERILASATEIFGRRGYAAASLRKIADEVGVSPAAILVHFGSKENLLMAVLDQWTVRSVEMHEASRGVDYLRHMIDIMHDHLSERGFIELFTTMAAEASDPQHPAHDFMVARYRWIEERLVREITYASENEEIRAVAPERIPVLARRIIAMMDGLQIQWLLDSDVDLAGEFEDFIEGLIVRLS
jgi:AcrR family transcriptional regulator